MQGGNSARLGGRATALGGAPRAGASRRARGQGGPSRRPRERACSGGSLATHLLRARGPAGPCAQSASSASAGQAPGGRQLPFPKPKGLTGCQRPWAWGLPHGHRGGDRVSQSAYPSSQGRKAAALTPSAKCCRPEGPEQWVKGWVGGFGEMGRGSVVSAQPEPEYQLTHAASTLMGPALEPPSGSGGRAE